MLGLALACNRSMLLNKAMGVYASGVAMQGFWVVRCSNLVWGQEHAMPERETTILLVFSKGPCAGADASALAAAAASGGDNDGAVHHVAVCIDFHKFHWYSHDLHATGIIVVHDEQHQQQCQQ